jgi:ferredoxin-NADP reductase
VVPGDRVEVRGPIGGYFVWSAQQSGPLLLVAGGSGIVPLMSMVRHRVAAGARVPVRLLYSSRTADEIIYSQELTRLAGADSSFEVFQTLTRAQPPGWTGYARRIDRQMLRKVLEPFGSSTMAYICGPTLLVESVANALGDLGLPPLAIRTERFGPTGI